MSGSFEVTRLERPAYPRKVLFALELIDPITLTRVSQGVAVVAEGLRGKPIVSSSGLFVWLKEGDASVQRVSIDPRALPYDKLEIQKAELTLSPVKPPLTTIELRPRLDYAFSSGITGVRGRLIEDRSEPPRPVRDATVGLFWLDEDGAWQRSPAESRTSADGDFVSILRLTSNGAPLLDAQGAVTLGLRARRDGVSERRSADVKVPQGRVADPSTLTALVFAWDELQL